MSVPGGIKLCSSPKGDASPVCPQGGRDGDLWVPGAWSRSMAGRPRTNAKGTGQEEPASRQL